MDHLSALELRLSHERCRLHNSKSQKEKELRQIWINQIEKEIQSEMAFLNKTNLSGNTELTEITDEELLNLLK